jgi:hypothetical protein
MEAHLLTIISKLAEIKKAIMLILLGHYPITKSLASQIEYQSTIAPTVVTSQAMFTLPLE